MPEQRERGISWKAVVVGFLVDIGISMCLAIAIGVVMGIGLVKKGVKPDQVNDRLMQDQAFLIISMVLGFASTAVGGYVAGRMAGRSELLHGALVGVIGILIGLAFIGSSPLWYTIAS